MWDQLEVRQGDHLPMFAGVILDALGEPVILDPAQDDVIISFIGQRTGNTFYLPGQIAVTIPGAITHDWQDTALFDVDTYDVTVNVLRGGDERFVAPTLRSSVLVVRPHRYGMRSGGDVAWDDLSSVWDDPLLSVWT